MELSKLKFPKMSGNFLIWILVAFIVLGFGKSSSVLGFNFFNVPDNKFGTSRKHYQGGKGGPVPVARAGIFPAAAPVGFNRFLGGNGLFLVAIIALLFICKDDKKDSRGDHDTEYCEED